MVSATLRHGIRGWLGLLLWMSCLSWGQGSQPIAISVDATQVTQRVLHAELSIPAKPGPLTLYYPKWMPADHSPDGPIWNLAGLKFAAGGKDIPWDQDSVDMYSFHVQVPQGAESITAKLDFLLSAPGPTIDFSASGTADLFVLMWNQVMLYPSGRARESAFLSTKAHHSERMEVQHGAAGRGTIGERDHVQTGRTRSAGGLAGAIG